MFINDNITYKVYKKNPKGQSRIGNSETRAMLGTGYSMKRNKAKSKTKTNL
jgi:hypothetical protein